VKDTNPRSGAGKTNKVPPYAPIPANPAPILPKAMPFAESPDVPNPKPPTNGGGSKVSTSIKPSKGGR
jgi:hypothetical protein